MKTSRRNFITRSGLALAGISTGLNSMMDAGNYRIATGKTSRKLSKGPEMKSSDAFKISVFSKHLQWLDYENMARAAAQIGLDGIDLTVRPQGHVLPENVERDLPKAMEAVKKAGLNIYMIATSILDPDDPLTDKILKTASSLGIQHYRMGWMHYDDNKTVEENISLVESSLRKLARLNEKYSISGEYQNHSGVGAKGIYFGGVLWDLAGILKNINSPWIGSQYDIYHATVEGANTWPITLKLISPCIRSIDIKDFKWIQLDGKAKNESVPLSEGIVDFKRYFSLLKQYKIEVPVSLHCEYPLGGAENGATTLTIKGEDVISSIKKDLMILKNNLNEAGCLTV
jgi:L-ribulose-5-phosphate 3-epimerase